MVRARSMLVTFSVLAVALAAATTAASAPTDPVRLAAPTDCIDNSGCGRGLLRVYHVDIRSVLTTLVDPDGGIDALDDGRAEVAIVFSANPLADRPDLLTVRDDRAMIGPENVVPIVRMTTLRRFGRAEGAVRDRIALVSDLLRLADLRDLEQLAIDGRSAEPIAGEWVEGHGLAAPSRQRGGPRIVFGYQAFSQNEITARIYALALRGAGFTASVRPVNGLRKATVEAFDSGRINASIGYATSSLRFLRRSSTTTSGVVVRRLLKAALARRGLTPLRYSRAYNARTFVMRRSVAATLKVRTLSDLQRLWPSSR